MKTSRLSAVVLLVAAMSCSDATGPSGRITDLDAARQLWQAQDLHTYAFTVQVSCFCANVDPLIVFVASDTVAGALDLKTLESVDRRLVHTVDGLFTFIQDAIDNHANLIRVEYDAAKGFPTNIDYDGSEGVADDEISYRVSDVHPVSPSARTKRDFALVDNFNDASASSAIRDRSGNR